MLQPSNDFFLLMLKAPAVCLLQLNIYSCMLQMSGLRMKMAGRFKPCVHMGCFDLRVFVEMNQRSRKASKYDALFCMLYGLSSFLFFLYIRG